MASDSENKERTQDLANDLITRCNFELHAGDFSGHTIINVLTALQIVVARILLVSGVPPATFMELVTKTMMRQETPS